MMRVAEIFNVPIKIIVLVNGYLTAVKLSISNYEFKYVINHIER